MNIVNPNYEDTEINFSFELSLSILKSFRKMTGSESDMEKILPNLSELKSSCKNMQQFKVCLYVHKMAVFLTDFFDRFSNSDEAKVEMGIILKKGYYSLCEKITQSSLIDIDEMAIMFQKVNLPCGKAYNQHSTSVSARRAPMSALRIGL